MICKSCGTSNPEGEYICRDCGDLLTLPPPDVEAAMAELGFEIDVMYADAPTLAIEIGESTHQFPLNEGCTILVGRGKNERADVAMIDLAPLQANKQGVSRQHAAIHVEAETVFLTDLDSTNGTYLNGEPLTPQRAYTLQSGDQVRFGSLEARVLLV